MSTIFLFLGITLCLAFLSFVYRIRCCTEKSFGCCAAVKVAYGGRGIRAYFPVFIYHYEGVLYERQSRQGNMDPYYFKVGDYHTIYINPSCPKSVIWRKKLSIPECLSLVFSILYLVVGASGVIK